MERSLILTRGELKIPCKVTVPDFGEIRRVVLGVHGMGGSMVDDIQKSIAEEMDMFYSATVRFDFPGHGESEWDKPLELQPCLDSLLAAAEFARESFPDVEDLCIFATGFGAYITLLCMEELIELPGTVKLVIQSPCLRMHDNLLTMKRINRETLAKDGKFVYSIMEVVYDPGHGITPAETYITPQLLEDNHLLLPEYYERVKHGVELTIFGLKRANDDQLSIYETILSDLTAMEERIYGNRT